MNVARFFRPLLAVCLSMAAAPALAGIMDDPDYREEFDGGYEIEIKRLAAPFEFPSSVSILPDGSALVTERPGRLWLVAPGSPAEQIEGVPPVLSRDHAGLLDVALDPDFQRNGIIYFSYSHGDNNSSTIRVMRAKLDRSRSCLEDQEVIFDSTPASSFENLGGRMVITDDGYLFLSIGDRQQRERAQDLADDAGSIIRIRTDGTIPKENPFVSVDGARPEIWSYGHRNPQGLALDTRTGRLWAHEHGPMGGDKLNLILSGANYGWPLVTYGMEYSGEPIGEGVEREGLERPLYHWEPDIAPSGLTVDSTDGVTTFWLGTLVGQSLVRLDIQGEHILGEARLLHDRLGRIRDVRLGPDGYLYLVTDDPHGGLFRIHIARAKWLE
jgi:glucose/arabinose dehydrogenase